METSVINVEDLAFLRIVDLNGKNGAVKFKKCAVVPLLINKEQTRILDISTGKIYSIDKLAETPLVSTTKWTGGSSGEMPEAKDKIYPTPIVANTKKELENCPKFIKEIIKDHQIDDKSIKILFNTWNYSTIKFSDSMFNHSVDKLLWLFADTKSRAFETYENHNPEVYTQFPKHELTEFGKLNKMLYDMSENKFVYKNEIIEFTKLYENVMTSTMKKRFDAKKTNKITQKRIKEIEKQEKAKLAEKSKEF